MDLLKKLKLRLYNESVKKISIPSDDLEIINILGIQKLKIQ